MKRKIDELREMMAAEDWHAALRLAARFPRLGEHKEPIQTGWSALTNPGFYVQIRKDPETLVEEGIQALKARYSHSEAS